jgi:transposase
MAYEDGNDLEPIEALTGMLAQDALVATAAGAQAIYEMPPESPHFEALMRGKPAEQQWLQEVIATHPGMRMTTDEKKREIEIAHYRGIRHRFICKALGVSATTVQNAVNHKPYQRPGRPLKVTPEIRDFADTNWTADARISDEQMAVRIENRYGAKLCRKTLCDLRKALGFKWRPPMHVQTVDDQQRTVRVWGLDEYRRRRALPEGDPRRIGIVIFSDESRFCRGSD